MNIKDYNRFIFDINVVYGSDGPEYKAIEFLRNIKEIEDAKVLFVTDNSTVPESHYVDMFKTNGIDWILPEHIISYHKLTDLVTNNTQNTTSHLVTPIDETEEHISIIHSYLPLANNSKCIFFCMLLDHVRFARSFGIDSCVVASSDLIEQMSEEEITPTFAEDSIFSILSRMAFENHREYCRRK
ncbi:hypothetical protein PCE1_003893 [Barthelona sp. PCE]